MPQSPSLIAAASGPTVTAQSLGLLWNAWEQDGSRDSRKLLPSPSPARRLCLDWPPRPPKLVPSLELAGHGRGHRGSGQAPPAEAHVSRTSAPAGLISRYCACHTSPREAPPVPPPRHATKPSQGKCCHCAHFTDEKTDAQEGSAV